MIRAITAVSAFLLATSSVVQAEDGESSLANLKPHQWGFKRQDLHGVDMNMSTREYAERSSRNRNFVSNTLMSYSKDTLESIGIPGQALDYMGAAMGVAVFGQRLNLNKSKTLALEFKDAGDPQRTLYFGAHLDWQ